MKNKKTNKIKMIRIAVISAVLVLLLAIFVYGTNLWTGQDAEDSNNAPTDQDPGNTSINLSPTTEEQEQAAASIKEVSLTKAPEAEDKNKGDSDKSIVGVIITRANVRDNILDIGILIEDVVKDGLCTLTLSKASSAPIVKTSGIQASAQSSTCAGFEIPIEKLSTGKWTIKIDFKNSSLTGSSSVIKDL